MAIPEPQLREAAWALFWKALREEAPEVLEDLKGLLPLCRKAGPALEALGVWGWRSLERAAGTVKAFSGAPLHALPERYGAVAGEAGQALLRLQGGLLAWAGRWGLAGPEEPLDMGLQALRLWAVDDTLPFGAFFVGEPFDKAGPVLDIPPFDPLAEGWGEFEDRARERFEAWLRAYREWARLRTERPELEKHARWLARRLKGESYAAIADALAPLQGEDAVRRGVVRLAKLLGLSM